MRRTTLFRRLAVATATPLLALALVSCGGSGGDTKASSSETGTSSTSPSDDASTPSEEATDSGGDVATGDTLSGKEFAALLSGSEANYTTMHMTLAGTAEGKPVKMDADIDAADKKHPAMRMIISSDDQTVEMILVNDELYLGDPNSGDPYLKMGSPQKGQVPFNLDQEETTSNPGGGFVNDKDIVSATFLGEDDLDGVKARHYAIKGKGDMKDAELWLDDQGRVVQIVGTVEGDQVTIGLSNFGEKVTIKPPKKFQDMSSLGG